jgi:hypothetical protein
VISAGAQRSEAEADGSGLVSKILDDFTDLSLGLR